MAAVTKNYLDAAGLQAYDALIKGWVNGTQDADGNPKAASQVIFRTVNFDNDNIYFYHKKDAVKGTDTADVTVPLAGSEVTKALAEISAIVTALGGTMASESPYTVTFPALTTDAKNTLVAAINELDAAIDVLNGADTVDGSIAKSIKEAIEGLVATEFALTEDNNDVISIYGIKETDGKIEKGSTKIDLAKVAKTGVAEDIATTVITDGAESSPEQLYAAGNVQGILEAIARDLNDLGSESQVTVEKQAIAETGYLSTYVVKQNGTQVGEKINIPKDYLVKSASVKTVETADEPYAGAKVGDKYIDFVINVRDASATNENIYLPLNDLMAAISGGTNAETTVAISDTNEITVTINKIAASKIAYDKNGTEETVQAALERIDGADTVEGSIAKAVKDGIDALDTNNDIAVATYNAGEITILGAVKETNGVIEGVETDNITIAPIATADITGLFG